MAERMTIMFGTWVENNERHCTRQFAIEHGIIDANDTVTTCKLWWDEYIIIH